MGVRSRTGINRLGIRDGFERLGGLMRLRLRGL